MYKRNTLLRVVQSESYKSHPAINWSPEVNSYLLLILLLSLLLLIIIINFDQVQLLINKDSSKTVLALSFDLDFYLLLA